MKNIFVTGIGTDVGKTVSSAILVQSLGWDYWKPIQAGDLDNADSVKVLNLIERPDVKIHKEYIRLEHALSPHAAAEYDNKKISLDDITIPETRNGLIIEGAGGLMVPLNDDDCIIDLIEKFKSDVIIVSKHYLGSINHSLLTSELLKSRNINVLGWIFNGKPDNATEDIIQRKSGKPKLLSIYPEMNISKQMIKKYAEEIITNGKLF